MCSTITSFRSIFTPKIQWFFYTTFAFPFWELTDFFDSLQNFLLTFIVFFVYPKERICTPMKLNNLFNNLFRVLLYPGVNTQLEKGLIILFWALDCWFDILGITLWSIYWQVNLRKTIKHLVSPNRQLILGTDPREQIGFALFYRGW